MTALAGNRDCLTFLLQLLVAAEAGYFGLLGVEGSIESCFTLLAGLIMASGSATAFYLALAIPEVMATDTVDLGGLVLVMGECDKTFARLRAFRWAKHEFAGYSNGG